MDSVEMSSKTPECWSRDAQAQALRVELGGGSWFIFPYSHFLFASLERSEDQDVLRISFMTHDVRVRGCGLMALLNAAQKMSIDWIKPLPSRYEKFVAAGVVFVEKIDVKELRDAAVS